MDPNLETAVGANSANTKTVLESAKGANAKNAYSIVLVDDDGTPRCVARAVCEQVAHSSNYEPQIQEFSDGSDAWKYLQGLQQQPDLLLTDLNMQFMGGDELIENARKKFPALNAILASAGNNIAAEKTLSEMAECLGYVFIRKPFDTQKLKDLVAKYAPKPAV